jgi:serine protease Do
VPNGQGIGFATPSSQADKIIAQLKTGKKIQRGWLGVTMQEIDENSAKALGLKEPKGVLVAQVIPGDPADKAGVRAGDVIVRAGGAAVDNPAGLLARVANLRPGEKVALTVLRQNKSLDLTVTLGERKLGAVAQQDARPSRRQPAVPELGLGLRPVESGEEAQSLGLDKPQGLLITEVQSGGAAAQVGILAGDVVVSANQQPVNSLEQLRAVLEGDARQKGMVMLQIKRQGKNIFKAIPLDKKR